MNSSDAAPPPVAGDGGLDAEQTDTGDRAVAETGSPDGSVSARNLCDGSENVRLKYQVLTSRSPLENGRDVLYENYFVVVGNCTYWILRDSWSEARTGTLSESESVQLAAALQYAAWAELSGTYLPSQPVNDVSPVRLTDGVSALLCVGICSSSDDRVHAIFDQAAASLDRLYANGRAVNGPIRVTGLVYANSVWPENYQAIDWPLPSHGPEYFYDPAKQATTNPGVLVTETSALDTLRKLRNRMHKSGFLWSNLGYIPVTAASQPGSRVELYFRDVTPVEN